MAENVKVLYTGKHTSHHGKFVARDLTVDKVYDARRPEPGEVDPDGLEVCLHDELWLVDDIGENVVPTLNDGFELVE